MPWRGRQAKSLVPILVLILSGCAVARAPQAIREAPAKPISVSQAQQEPERFRSQRVRWGGTIIAAHNLGRTTEIEILSRPLDSNGEPRGTKPGEGRFIAQLAGFVNPAEYPEKRLVTVTGRLAGVETRPIGEYPYSYPVVTVEHSYLWPQPPPPRPPYYYSDPWYHPSYRPWYGPWHPWNRPWYF